jgi:hypothetical protein
LKRKQMVRDAIICLAGLFCLESAYANEKNVEQVDFRAGQAKRRKVHKNINCI